MTGFQYVKMYQMLLNLLDLEFVSDMRLYSAAAAAAAADAGVVVVLDDDDLSSSLFPFVAVMEDFVNWNCHASHSLDVVQAFILMNQQLA
ncbi:unnamed protein product [[Candida] boidinii]|uniref:Unnamed protein product n=1 Tax=Candida boidinii TaxID=5477 RepID=A0ACB5U3Z1_CANBO|nr:unnamed protein product [[Candida] boidinii]